MLGRGDGFSTVSLVPVCLFFGLEAGGDRSGRENMPRSRARGRVDARAGAGQRRTEARTADASGLGSASGAGLFGMRAGPKRGGG